MIGIGGCIGSGVLMSCGGGIDEGGGLGGLIGYGVIGGMAFSVTTWLGEMGRYLGV